MFVLKLFGGISIEGESGPLSGRAAQRHRLALLALLAASPAGTLSREKLIAYLWPEAEAERGRHLLSNSLYLVRQALGEAVCGSADALRIEPERLWCDVREFEAALARGEFERAVGFYRGPFLDGFFLASTPEFERWVEEQRERFARSYAQALEALAEEREGEGDFQAAAEWWRKLAAQDPYSSRVVLRLMQALVTSGDSAGALQHARVHETLLRSELEVEPDPEVLALAEQLRQTRAENGSGALARTLESASSPVFATPPAEVTSEAYSSAAASPNADAHHHVSGTLPNRSVPTQIAAQPRRRSEWGGRRTPAAVLIVASAISLIALATVTVVDRAGPGSPLHSDRAVEWSTLSSDVRSIVVLPFADLSPGGDHEYFSDGMTDELISALVRVEGLRVVARTSAFSFKGQSLPVHEIAQRLQVRHVLEGSVRKSGERLRISAQLVNAETGFPLWAETYDRELSDIFAIQQEISRAIVRALELELSHGSLLAQGTRDPEAYDLYLQGRYHWNLGSVWDRARQERILAFYRRAIERDPSYAAPYAGMADAYSHANDPHNAKAAALQALALDSTLAEAHTALAYVLAFFEWRWKEAERALARALELNPHHVLAYMRRASMFTAMGRDEDAIADIERAVRMDPLSFSVSYNRGLIYFHAGRLDEAVRFLRHTLAMDSTRREVRQSLASAYHGWGDTAQAAMLFQSAGDTLFAILAAGGREEGQRAIRMAETRPEPMSPVNLAKLYAHLGMHDRAFASLEAAVRSRDRWVPFALRSPELAPLRSDPRYGQLRQQIGLE